MSLESTVIRDSIVGDAWIQQTAMAVPIQRVLGADGQPTGDILTGPVRLAFTDNLMDLGKDGVEGEDKYGATLLFTPFADFRIFYEEYYAACAREFPQHWDAQSQNYFGLHSPFHDQSEKARYGGYTPGCIFMNSSSLYRPPIVDSRQNPIVDKSKIYPGVWAICSVKPYPYGKDGGKGKDGPKKKGIGFGLQTVMIIGDDTRFGGGAPDTKQTYAGINIQAPIVRPDQAQQHAAAGGGQPQAPAPGIPGYTAPGGGAPQPGQPQQGFQMQQQTYTPAPQQQAPQQQFAPQGQPQQNFAPPQQQQFQQPAPQQQFAPQGQPPMQQFAPQGQPQPGFQTPGAPTAQAHSPQPTSNAPGFATGATPYPSNGYNPNAPMQQG